MSNADPAVSAPVTKPRTRVKAADVRYSKSAADDQHRRSYGATRWPLGFSAVKELSPCRSPRIFRSILSAQQSPIVGWHCATGLRRALILADCLRSRCMSNALS
jgi:hypothetical protein